jgi:MYXO-CTERM domain-containing protein
MRFGLPFCATLLVAATGIASAAQAAPFRIFMIHSTAADHITMSTMARTVLADMGKMNDFAIDPTTDNTLITETNLAKYDVFLSMHQAPFEIKVEQRAAFENFIKSGKGWVGVHAAGLVLKRGDWPFYDELMGQVAYVVHPAKQTGVVLIEDRNHPLTKNLPASLRILDEWYEWTGNPRANVHVLAKADETTYTQVKPAGDHPLWWTIEKYQRAVYIGTGHDVTDWQNPTFNILMRDALLWAARRLATDADGGADGGGGDGAAPTDAPTTNDAASDSGEPADAAAEASGSGGSGGGSSGSSGSGGSAVDAGGGTGGQGTGGSGGAGPGTSTSSDGCSCAHAGGQSNERWLSWLPIAIFFAWASRRRRR